MLEVRNLSFSYSRSPILRDVSFVVSPGEVVSIVGGNGAGKTTLLRILSTLIVPDGGSIVSEGSNVFEHPQKYRRQLGYMPETPALFEDMTIKEYLTYRAMLKGEPSKRLRRRIAEAVEMCRIENLLRTPIYRLSVGMKKRVAFADALLLRPRVLLLDDFLSGLDAEMREIAGSILSQAAAFSSVIVTGHEIADLVKWTTRFLVLRSGFIASTIAAAGVELSELESRVRHSLIGGAS